MAKNKKGPSPWALLLAGFISGVALAIFLLKFSGILTPEPPPVKPPPPEEAPVQGPVAPPRPAVPEKPLPHAKKNYPRVAIVIDDMGQDMKKLRELVELNAEITVAVIPNLSHSAQTAKEAHEKGLEVLLHLPMEPKDLEDNNPGKGALITSMTPEEMNSKITADLKTVPYADGVNNHMGSKFTEDEEGMRVVLTLMKSKRLFFLDSRTSSNSVAGKVARELGVKNADRNVFLDNSRDVAYIKGQLRELVGIARKRGTAIAIGHPHPETIQAIRESLDGLNGSVEIVKLSEIINGGGAEPQSKITGKP